MTEPESATPPPANGGSRPAPIDSFIRSGGLLLILAAVTAAGLYLQSASHPGSSVAGENETAPPLFVVYAAALISEWALFYYCWAGMHARRVKLAEVMGPAWGSWRRAAGNILIAAAFWAVWEGVAWVATLALGANHAKSISVLVPRSPFEYGLWIAVAVSAGICEEFVFRGYLQRQLCALTGSATAAVAGQALIFGVSHGYQGIHNMILISILGLLYGSLAQWRRNLRPGILAHVWSDIFAMLR
jgi:membrane protease YdiL (CAAX protease family)